MADELPPTKEISRFAGAKTAFQCISVGQPTGPRTIDQLLLLVAKKKITDKNVYAGQPLTPQKYLVNLHPCVNLRLLIWE